MRNVAVSSRIGAVLFAAVLVAGFGEVSAGAPSSSPSAPGAAAQLPPFNFEIYTLSNRADLISDGNALVEVRVPKNVPMHKVMLTLNGADVRSSFVADDSARTFRGVLEGMEPGENVFVADANGQGRGRPWASLTITNHVRGGPILLGSQAMPWVCATPTPVPQSGNTPASNASGLSTFAVDAQCNIATEYKLFYRTTTPGCSTGLPDPSPPAAPPTNNCFKPYTPGSAPADLAMTTTTAGVTVPYIVRVERGTMNRGIYDVAVLFDPSQPWTALAPQSGWNGKVVYSFGASTGQPRLQFRTSQNWADDAALSRGFMVVDNSVTDSSRNSNRTLVAETVMMMKEHIVDTYGEIAYTMGNGCSGGSIQQNTVVSIFPGLLDGIQPSCNYPDSITTGLEVLDCVLLVNAYVSPEWNALMSGLTQAQINAKKTAINGHLDHLGCQSWNNAFGSNNKPGNYVPILVVNQNTGALAPVGAPRNNCLLPAALVYDPVTNPNGTRCGDADLATAVWGTTAGVVPGTVRARQTLRQRRHRVRPERAAVRCDHARGVRDAEREGRRFRRRLEPHADAYDGRPAGPRHRLPRRHRVERHEPRQGPHHRLARLRRAGHPLHLAHLLRTGARSKLPTTETMAIRSSGVTAPVWSPPRRPRSTAVTLAVVPDDGHVAVATQRVLAQADAQLGAHPGRRDRGQAGYGVRPVLPDGRHQLHHPGHRHGAVRRRPEARHALVAAAGGRRVAAGEHPQVPAQATRPGRLRAGHTRPITAGAAERRVPRRRVRLDEARRRSTRGDLAPDLRRRPRRAAVAARSRATSLERAEPSQRSRAARAREQPTNHAPEGIVGLKALRPNGAIPRLRSPSHASDDPGRSGSGRRRECRALLTNAETAAAAHGYADVVAPAEALQHLD